MQRTKLKNNKFFLLSQKFSFLLILLFFLVSLISCASIQKNDTEYSTIALEKEEIIPNLEKNFLDNGKTYIFIRIYNPTYKQTFSSANFLKQLIKLIDVNQKEAYHCAIGFSLEDEFLGITSSNQEGKNYLKLESCTNISNNEYMAKCDPIKSTQTTYALEVTTEEFQKALKLINQYINNKEAYYSLALNFSYAGKQFSRKFFTSKEKQNIKNMKIKKKGFNEEKEEESFVCSSFIAYILQNSVKAIEDFFQERQIDYNYILPSDLTQLPKIKELFSSNWQDYDLAAQKYIQENWKKE